MRKLFDFSRNQDFSVEIIVVNDASTDASAQICERIAAWNWSGEGVCLKIFSHEKNCGKGAAMQTGFIHAVGDFVGIHDADEEYDPNDYLEMLKPLLAGKADVVYGSRFLRPDTRRVLYFYHTWMNRALTCVSNLFTGLDLTDIHTCYKLFRKDVITAIAPKLKEKRFAFCPEITARVAEAGYRVYECAISYSPRSYEEGKKIGWKDGLRALYCNFHYGAHIAPLPMQILIYMCIGTVCMAANMTFFMVGNALGVPVDYSIAGAFILSAVISYVLCVLILFKHNARWKTPIELFLYVFCTVLMGLIDFVVTKTLIALTGYVILSKFAAAPMGFVGNFMMRKWLVFWERNKK
jgi:putative flippase GtrA